MSRTAIIIGTTGLIGSALLDQLLADDYFDSIISLGRRTIENHHSKLQQFVVNFENHKELEHYISGAEVVFCAVGTTQAKTNGDEEAYKKVDYDIPVNAATAAAKTGVYGFILVSAIGADADSNNFYLKLKGVTESAVCKQAIPQVAILRPSLLLGKRNESRLGESIAQVVMPVFSPLFFGSTKKYKPIKAETVAKAMLAIAKNGVREIKVYEYEAIKKLGDA